MVFGRKKTNSKTVLLVDVESGSVAAALAHLTPGSPPKLFGETRVALPLLSTRDVFTLAHYVEKATREALQHVAHTAARLRGSERLASAGTIAGASAFLGAPWGVPDLEIGTPRFLPTVRRMVGDEITAFAGDVPRTFNSAADSIAYGASVALPDENILLCAVRGEIAELLHIGQKGVLGYATIPVGSQSLARTLRVHAGVSQEQVPSLLSLSKHAETLVLEPLSAAARHFLEHFSGAAEELLAKGAPRTVYVLGEQPHSDWVAQTLGESQRLGPLFPQGGVVRTLSPHHFYSHVDTRKGQPDLFLMLDALFAGRLHKVV